jgi:hypothetical protein
VEGSGCSVFESVIFYIGLEKLRKTAMNHRICDGLVEI